MFQELTQFIRDQYKTEQPIPLHAPVFSAQAKEFVGDAIDSTFVSSVGAYVNRFEQEIAGFTGSPSAVATVNGTAALHIALIIAGVKAGDLVITQALSFVATCNAIRYIGADPIFVDVDLSTLGLSATAIAAWLDENAYVDGRGVCRHRAQGRIIKACLPMHTFGHPADVDGLLEVCTQWNLQLVEDAAESLGSFYKGRHTGTFGVSAALSFNGNKVITTGAGGTVLSGVSLGQQAKHLTTTAKLPHDTEYVHDELGYNYRLANLNAALGCAQVNQLDLILEAKRTLAYRYIDLFKGSSLSAIDEPKDCVSNFWLNAVICENKEQRDSLLAYTNKKKIMTRPIWSLLSTLPMYRNSLTGPLTNSLWLVDRVVNLPSSVLPELVTK